MASEVYPLFREAKVVSTKDPKELGRIQLHVFPELADVPEGDLPWCFPMASGPHDGDFSTPLKDQWVYCVVWNKYWSEITFLPWCMPDPKKPRFGEFKDNLVSKVKDYKGTPDIQHAVGSILEDKFVKFHDTKESQHGFLHPSGTYALINKDGEIFVHSVKKLTFHNDDDTVLATVDSESGDIELKTKGGVKETVDKNVEQEIKGNWKVKVTGNADIETTGDTKIKSTGKLDVESTGPATIKSSAPVKIESQATTIVKATSMVTVDAPVLDFKGSKTQGTVPPTGNGIGCAFPMCPIIKLPHSG